MTTKKYLLGTFLALCVSYFASIEPSVFATATNVAHDGSSINSTYFPPSADTLPQGQYIYQDITPEDFSFFSSQSNPFFVYFIQDDCRRCVLLSRTLNMAGRELSKSGPTFPIATLNISKYPSIAKSEELPSTPSFFIYTPEGRISYSGGFHPEAIADAIRDAAFPSFHKTSSRKDVDEFILRDSDLGVAVVGIFSPSSIANAEHEEGEAVILAKFRNLYISMANEMKKMFRFYLVDDVSISHTFGLPTNTQGIVILHSFSKDVEVTEDSVLKSTHVIIYPLYGDDEKIHDSHVDVRQLSSTFHEASSGGLLSRWVVRSSTPLIGRYTSSTQQFYLSLGTPLLKFILPFTIEENAEKEYTLTQLETIHSYESLLRPLALAHRQITFVICDPIDVKVESKYYAYDEARQQNAPLVLIHDSVYDLAEHYRMPVEVYSDREDGLFANSFSLEAFISNYELGLLSVFLRSAKPLQPFENRGPILHVTGSEFHATVDQNTTKDILLLAVKDSEVCPDCQDAVNLVIHVAEELRKTYPQLQHGHGHSHSHEEEVVDTEFANIHSSLLVTQINISHNDIYKSRYPMRKYPTIYFKPAGGGDPVRFLLEEYQTWSEQVEGLKKLVVRFSKII